MGFLDEARAEQEGKPHSGARCLMCETISALEDGAELAEALADRRIHASTIISVLERRGVRATDNQVGNHRRQHVPGWRA